MKLLYFASVRQKLGKSEEDRTLPQGIDTVGGLMAYLSTLGPEYGEAFKDPARLKAAVNQVHAGPHAPLCDSDEVAFFPPVTGG